MFRLKDSTVRTLLWISFKNTIITFILCSNLYARDSLLWFKSMQLIMNQATSHLKWSLGSEEDPEVLYRDRCSTINLRSTREPLEIIALNTGYTMTGKRVGVFTQADIEEEQIFHVQHCSDLPGTQPKEKWITLFRAVQPFVLVSMADRYWKCLDSDVKWSFALEKSISCQLDEHFLFFVDFK